MRRIRAIGVARMLRRSQIIRGVGSRGDGEVRETAGTACRKQWASIAERAPDDATADYLHQVFALTVLAIDGLEKALAGLGLLDQALALDLRRPQDYYHRPVIPGGVARCGPP